MNPPETFLEDVRRDLAEAGKDLLSDETIVQQLRRSYIILSPWATDDDDLMQQCITALGAYLSYLAYTSMAEIKLGSIPETSSLRSRELKHAAYLLISQIAPMNKDLILDPEVVGGGFSGNIFSSEMIESVLEDD